MGQRSGQIDEESKTIPLRERIATGWLLRPHFRGYLRGSQVLFEKIKIRISDFWAKGVLILVKPAGVRRGQFCAQQPVREEKSRVLCLQPSFSWETPGARPKMVLFKSWVGARLVLI